MSDRLQPALSDSEFDSALDAATDLGTDAGKDAASWVFDGNTADDTYRAILAGIADGDPAILDTLPSADLSGQWADGPTPRTIAADVIPGYVDAAALSTDNVDAFADAYTDAFNDAAVAEVERIAREHLAR